jgi:hypothetical protein
VAKKNKYEKGQIYKIEPINGAPGNIYINRFEKGQIYKIEPLNGAHEDIYIGVTCKSLEQCFQQHKNDYTRYLHGNYHFVTSFHLFDKYGFENCKITLLETINTNSTHDMASRKSFYIRTLECVNKCIPLRSKKEYHADNRVSLLEYRKRYRVDNKESILEYGKRYRADNKESIAEYRKQYCSKKYTCECGATLRLSFKSKHNKTAKHKTIMESKHNQCHMQHY